MSHVDDKTKAELRALIEATHPEENCRATFGWLDKHPDDDEFWEHTQREVDAGIQIAIDKAVADGVLRTKGLNEHGKMVYRKMKLGRPA